MQQRPIEFRAWDGFNMYYDNCIDFTEDGTLCFSGDIDSPYEGCPIQPGQSVMQFTGLKDRHGKKIFEGDIVKHKWWYDWREKNPITIHKVISGAGGFYLVNENELFQEYPMTNKNNGCVDEYEVIGNVFEHKHLLGK